MNYEKQNTSESEDEQIDDTNTSNKINNIKNYELIRNKVDEEFGYTRYVKGNKVTGYIFNQNTTSYTDETNKKVCSGVEFYIIKEDGKTQKAMCSINPYFYIKINDKCQNINIIETYLENRFEQNIHSIERVIKEDLDLENHLIGLRQLYLKINFYNTNDLITVRNILLNIIKQNKKNNKYIKTNDIQEEIIDIREYDIPYSQRLLIDTGIRIGYWYDIIPIDGTTLCKFVERKDIVDRPNMKIVAWDIETYKQPLKFPNADNDPIIMISMMIDDGDGIQLCNRKIISQDIDNFVYKPTDKYVGEFIIENCIDEKTMLERFYKILYTIKPTIYVTYNGDYFDWPYVKKRSKLYGMNIESLLGIYENIKTNEFYGLFSIHLDAFSWVKRDSYLPQGSHGQKAVTKAKLKYDPIEIDPEEMVQYAIERPHILASYSVSDAVSTYYLYIQYIHNFIFSLCTIIPMSPSDVLRKGSGTLCEMLLMVEAYSSNVIAPNKQLNTLLKYFNGHQIESETYIGGHVECLNSGVYRSDIPIVFTVDVDYIKKLMNSITDICNFTLYKELKDGWECINYETIKDDIYKKLNKLLDKKITILPKIYHLDVSAMYPNIILTNRLQPYAMVNKSICNSCEYYDINNTEKCQRYMDWSWRGKLYNATENETKHIYMNIEEKYKNISEYDKNILLRKNIEIYSRKVYKKTTYEKIELRQATICQREHPFYINTVESFRDRRYEYKNLQKKWLENLFTCKDDNEKNYCNNMIQQYDSMQLAHKCIQNSFYGYVMRKGSRWSSIEMAGVVTRTGAKIIQIARKLVQSIGKVLELDTDGIWCILPDNFPDVFEWEQYHPIKKINKRIRWHYTCAILNEYINKEFSNEQYQVLDTKGNNKYNITKRCTIEFEVDGPYYAMVQPASKVEGKDIKKRYAVFNKDKNLAELKGFEIKRRGELKIIKLFQEEIFSSFLNGINQKECYYHASIICNRWQDILDTYGKNLYDEDIFEQLSENKNMSESLEKYGESRSTSITTAKRLGEFLGEDMIRGKGQNCRFIISKYPINSPISDRAIPVAIFSSDENVQRYYLTRWQKDPSVQDLSIRNILDWEYYTARQHSVIQKIVTIPAAFQGIINPVPRVRHPEWVSNKLRIQEKGEHHPIKTFLHSADDRVTGDMISMDIGNKDFIINDIEDFINGTTATTTIATSPPPPSSPPPLPNPTTEILLQDDKNIPSIEKWDEWCIWQERYWLQLYNKSITVVPEAKRMRYDVIESCKLHQLNDTIEDEWHIVYIGKLLSGIWELWVIEVQGGTGFRYPRKIRQRQCIELYTKDFDSVETNINPIASISIATNSTVNIKNNNAVDMNSITSAVYMNSATSAVDITDAVDTTNTVDTKINKNYTVEKVKRLLPYKSRIENVLQYKSRDSIENIKLKYIESTPQDFSAYIHVGTTLRNKEQRYREEQWQDEQHNTKKTLKIDTEKNILLFSPCNEYLKEQEDTIYPLLLYHYIDDTTTYYCIVPLLPLIEQETIDKLQIYIWTYQNSETTINKNIRKNIPLSQNDINNNTRLNIDKLLNFWETILKNTSNNSKDKEYKDVQLKLLKDNRIECIISQSSTNEREIIKNIKNILNIYERRYKDSNTMLLQFIISNSNIKINISYKIGPIINVSKELLNSNIQITNTYDGNIQNILQYIYVCWKERLQQSRTIDIPICNLIDSNTTIYGNNNSQYILCLDIQYTRSLRLYQHIPWYIKNIQDEDIPKILSINTESNKLKIKPGCYREYAVNIHIHTFILNAIQTYTPPIDTINNIKDNDSNDDDLEILTVNSVFDIQQQQQQCQFNLVRKNNINELEILQYHTYRWQNTSISILYNPILLQYIEYQIEESKKKLIKKIQDNYLQYIILSYDYILLCTNKREERSAKMRINNFINEQSNDKEFSYIIIDIYEWYDTVLIGDQYNIITIPLLDTNKLTDISMDDISILNIQWNSIKYFDTIVKEYIYDIFQKFLLSPLIIYKKDIYKLTTYIERDNVQKKYIQEYILSDIQSMILRMIDILYNNKELRITIDNIIDILQEIFMALYLDQYAKDPLYTCWDNQILKTNNLNKKNIHVIKFPNLFIDKSSSIILSKCICTNCGIVKNIDLLRDPSLIYIYNGTGILSTMIKKIQWRCNCGIFFSRNSIESYLLYITHQYIDVFLNQSFKCSKCKLFQHTPLQKYCTCSKNLMPSTLQAVTQNDILSTLNTIAIECQFTVLVDLVSRSRLLLNSILQ